MPQYPEPVNSRTARRLNIILDMRLSEPGVAEFELFVGNKHALPPGFLKAHCRRWRATAFPLVLRPVIHLLAGRDALCGTFPDTPTHVARFTYPYNPAVGLGHQHLHQPVSAALATLRRAGFLLRAGCGMDGTWSPEEQYAYRLKHGLEREDFPIILPRRDHRQYVVCTVKSKERG